MPDKLITVIMSTYNESEEYITLAVNSILNQSYSNIEFIIVCDNPNNNEIKSLLGHFQKEDKRIVIIENTQNIGLAESLNKAISISRGEYIARMDADDISHPRRLEVEVAFLEDNPDYGVVYTARQDIDEKGYKKDTSLLCPKNDKALLSSLSYGSIISHPTVMIRKKDLSVVGGYQNFPTGQDYDLWLRFRQKGIKFHFINQVLFYYRIRQNSISVSKKSLQWICSEYARFLDKQNGSFVYDAFVQYKQAKESKKSFQRYIRFLNKNDFGSKKSILSFLRLISCLIASSDCRKRVFNSLAIRRYTTGCRG